MRDEDRLALFKVGVEEYRFQVLLNWDRTKHHLLFNAGLLGIATALMKLNPSASSDALVAALLLLGSVNAAGGAHAVKVGHDYYRRARTKMTSQEKALGLLDDPELQAFSLTTTPGMREEIAHIQQRPEDTKRPRLGNITDQFRAFLWAISAVEFVAGIWLVARRVL